MSALASLVRVHDRMVARGEVAPPGFSMEKISFLIPLNNDGTVAHQPVDLRQGEGKKKFARLMAVPASFKRPGISPKPFFLWDKTSYVLGVTAGDGKRTAREHEAFVQGHLKWLAETADAGLQALLKFLESWSPEQFVERGWPEEMKDQNVVFALEHDRLRGERVHDRPAAKAILARLTAGGEKTEAPCLITGERGPVARLHPAIKGVWGAQSSGASIVSFNLDAFTSYGHEQGDNAPISESAAAAYTAVLNRFLERGSRHRIQIGDASTVFWAEAADDLAADEANAMFAGFLGVNEEEESKKVGDILARLREGRPIESFAGLLPKGVRFHILGLSPNAARLSVRFYIEDDFGVIAERYLRHLARMRVDPPPREDNPSLWRLLIETAVLRKSENIQPNLAGEWLRAILNDTPYPLTLLVTLIMRMRADHDISALRAAILKSILIKNFGMEREAPVSLDLANRDKGYLLGRLFAVYEYIQLSALGRNVNATIKDKFYGAASAQPRKVFRLLDANSVNHLSKIGKQKPGLRVNLEKDIGGIMEAMAPDADPFPASLPDRSQALFALGYYHQRNSYFRKADNSELEETPQ